MVFFYQDFAEKADGVQVNNTPLPVGQSKQIKNDDKLQIGKNHVFMLNLPQDEDGADRLRWLKFIGIPLGLFFLFLVGATVWNVEPSSAQPQLVGSAQAIGQSLFTDYVLPFEATSLLILIALIGAVVFAKKDL